MRGKNFKSCWEDDPAVKDTSSELKPYRFAHKCLVNYWALLQSRRTNSFHPLAGSLNHNLGNNWSSVLHLSIWPLPVLLAPLTRVNTVKKEQGKAVFLSGDVSLYCFILGWIREGLVPSPCPALQGKVIHVAVCAHAFHTSNGEELCSESFTPGGHSEVGSVCLFIEGSHLQLCRENKVDKEEKIQ